MIQILKFIGVYLQLITFIMSLVYLYKYKQTPMKIMPIYLGVVAFVEVLCGHFYPLNNVWIYNILNWFQLNMCMLIFIQYLRNLELSIGKVLIVIFNLFYISSFFVGLNEFWLETASFGYVMGMIVVFYFLFMVFKQMLEIENMQSLTRNLLFWYAFSLLLFNTTSLPLFSLSNWGNVLGEFRFSIFYILFFALVLSHVVLITGFVWSKKKFTY
jgi:hypothetical protein